MRLTKRSFWAILAMALLLGTFGCRGSAMNDDPGLVDGDTSVVDGDYDAGGGDDDLIDGGDDDAVDGGDDDAVDGGDDDAVDGGDDDAVDGGDDDAVDGGDDDTVDPEPFCGDGELDIGEECEIGSAHCFMGCTCADGFNPNGMGLCIAPESFCGDGVLDSGEQCETGAENCLIDCLCSDGYTADGFGHCVVPPPSCGNGSLEAGEDCESYSLNCLLNCTCANGYVATDDGFCVNPGPNCGNGILEVGEECEDFSPFCLMGCTCAPNYNPNMSGVCIEDAPPTGEICNNGVDDDGDGTVDCNDTDCTTAPICMNDPTIAAQLYMECWAGCTIFVQSPNPVYPELFYDLSAGSTLMVSRHSEEAYLHIRVMNAPNLFFSSMNGEYGVTSQTVIGGWWPGPADPITLPGGTVDFYGNQMGPTTPDDGSSYFLKMGSAISPATTLP